MKIHHFLLILCFSALKAQEKDTLFFYYDNMYISQHAELPYYFYLKDGSAPNCHNFYFEKVTTLNNQNVNTKDILNLKKFIYSSTFYNKKNKPKVNDYNLWEYLNDYVIFLVKKSNKKKQYIQVQPYIILK